MIYFASALFLVGLLASFSGLYTFERRVRQQRVLRREWVGDALRRLIASGLLSGVGMGLLGLTAFIGARRGEVGWTSYLWAALFVLFAVFGWAAILLAAFLARVNALEHRLPSDDSSRSASASERE